MSTGTDTDGAAPRAPKSPIAARLGEARVELRRDVEVSRHVFRGEVAYVIQDPLTFQSHRFSVGDYYVLTNLSVDRTLSECFERLVASGRLDEDDEERFYTFVLSQHRNGFLKLPISDESTLYQRYLAKAEQRRSGRAMSFLFWQIPLWNPDRFLSRTLRFARPFFTRGAFALWCALIAAALYVLTKHWAEFQRPVADIFSGSNLPLLWTTLVVLKVAHEFGHAYACKRFGGHVPEMGVYLILCTPCAFVDTSAAWGFTRKRERLAVNLAGMYVEIAIAAIALLCWSVATPGVGRECLHNVVILASVVTIGFNINPLMRYDGYYALADLIEIPNLRARSQAYATAVLKRGLFGVPVPNPPKALGMRLWLFSFGVFSALYKIVLVLGISMAIALKFPIGGLLLAGVYGGKELVRLVKKTIPYLWFSDEVARVRLRAILCSVLFAGALPLAVAGIPVPSSIKPQAVVMGGVETVRRAEVSGFLLDVPARPGDVVAPGDDLVRLSEPDKAANLEMARARLDGARLRQRVWAFADRAAAAEEEQRIAALVREVEHLEADLAKLTIRAPEHGLVVDCLDANERGRFVRRGEPVATVVRGAPTVRALVDQEGLASTRPEVGLEVEFRAPHRPERVFRGRIAAVRPVGSRALDQDFLDHLDLTEFSLHPVTREASRSQFEITIALDETARLELRHGMTGRVRLVGEAEPIGAVLHRKLVLFLSQLGR